MGWTFLNNLIDITGYITADSTWRQTATITELPSGTTVVWLRIRQSDATARTIGARHPNITSEFYGVSHVNRPQHLFVGVDSRTFGYYATDKVNSFWEILAYSENAGEAYATAGAFPTKTPSVIDTYEDKTFSELPYGAAFAALLIDQGSYPFASGFRHDGATYDEYYAKAASGLTTAFCPLAGNVGEIKVANTSKCPCYLVGGLVSGAARFDTPQAITVTSTGWLTIDASVIFPAGANLAVLEVRNINTSTTRLCALRNTGSSENITAGVNIYAVNPGPSSQFRLVGLNANRQFDINVSNITDVLVKAYGYISNSVDQSMGDYWRLTTGMLEFEFDFNRLAKKRKSMHVEIEFN